MKNKVTEAEKQLLIVINHFRSRYALMMGFTLETPKTKKNLELFAQTWIGINLVDWSQAYLTLEQQKQIQFKNQEYNLTQQGKEICLELEKDTPFWLYEYNNFFAKASQSPAHQKFCESVYGQNLCQHGMADIPQLDLLLKELNLKENSKVLDLGCGNGDITHYLATKTKANFIGLDISSEGIRQAQQKASPRKNFFQGNMNTLPFPKESFDTIVAIDTLYYVENLENTLLQLIQCLKPHGQLGVFFNEWVMEVSEKEKLRPEKNELGLLLTKANLKFTTIDLSQADVIHWNKKAAQLQKQKEEFAQEKNLELYEYRYTEAVRYSQWEPEKRSRHFYQIKL